MKKAQQTEQVVQIALDDLVADPDNRKVGGFNPAKLEQLAESIKAVGVQQPAVVREIECPEGTVFKYEIVAGERRWRASKIAGLATLPCVVRNLDDVTVLKIRTIENLQREDIHPLDEAGGYAGLIEKAGYDVEHLAEEVGKSISYVYQRLKLLDLIPPVRKMLVEGKLAAGHAILIARLQPDQQKEILDSHFLLSRGDSGPSVRELDEHIRESVMMDLGKTSFKKDDADLVPAAGACTTCQKRTGFQPALFADVCKKDFCLDPACFKAKLDALVVRRKKELEGESHLLVRETYEYIPPTKRKNQSSQNVLSHYDWTERKAKEDGAVRCLVVDGVGRGRLTWGKKQESYRHELTPQEKAATERKRREFRVKQEVRQLLYARVVGELSIDHDHTTRLGLWRVIATHAWKRLENNNQVLLAKLEHWDKPDKKKGVYGNGIERQGQAMLAKMAQHQLFAITVKIALVGEHSYNEYWSAEPVSLYAAATALGRDPKAIEAEARKEVAAKYKAKAKAPADKKKKAVQSKSKKAAAK